MSKPIRLVSLFLLFLVLVGCNTSTTVSTEPTTSTTTISLDANQQLRANAQAASRAFLTQYNLTNKILLENNLSVTVYDAMSNVIDQTSASIEYRFDFEEDFQQTILIADGVKTESRVHLLDGYKMLAFTRSNDVTSRFYSDTTHTMWIEKSYVTTVFDIVFLPEDATYSYSDGLYLFTQTLETTDNAQVLDLFLMIAALGATEAELQAATVFVTVGYFAETKEMLIRAQVIDLPIAAQSGTADASYELVIQLPEVLELEDTFDYAFDHLPPASPDLVEPIAVDVPFTYYYLQELQTSLIPIWLEPGIYRIVEDCEEGTELTPSLYESMARPDWTHPDVFTIEEAGYYHIQMYVDKPGSATVTIVEIDLVDVGSIDTPVMLDDSVSGFNEGIEDYQYYLYEGEEEGLLMLTIETFGEGSLSFSTRYQSYFSDAYYSIEGNSMYLYYTPHDDDALLQVSGDYVGEYNLEVEFVPKRVNPFNPTNDPFQWFPLTSEFSEVLWCNRFMEAPRYYFQITTAGYYHIGLLVFAGNPRISLLDSTSSTILPSWTLSRYFTVGTYVIRFTDNDDSLDVFIAYLVKDEPS